MICLNSFGCKHIQNIFAVLGVILSCTHCTQMMLSAVFIQLVRKKVFFMYKNKNNYEKQITLKILGFN